jgi:hypothetical protein
MNERVRCAPSKINLSCCIGPGHFSGHARVRLPCRGSGLAMVRPSCRAIPWHDPPLCAGPCSYRDLPIPAHRAYHIWTSIPISID